MLSTYALSPGETLKAEQLKQRTSITITWPDVSTLTLRSSSRIIEGLFVHRDAITRHLDAPMLREREAYLLHSLEAGYSQRFLKERASTLLHVIRLLPTAPPAVVNEAEIVGAGKTWASQSPESKACKREASFLAVARSWFRFLGVYDRGPRAGGRFALVLQDFLIAMERDLGYLPTTSRSCGSAVTRFLSWMSPRRHSLSSISLADVDDFLYERREGGLSRRTSINEARSLRTFFRYAESRGWNDDHVSKTLQVFEKGTRSGSAQHPPWKHVRKMLVSLDCSRASHCRAKAVLLLASVYGLRRSELVRLTLDDLDWENEVLTVRRSKRGRVQQFPLRYEVGEAIICYLQKVRQRSQFRNLFLTLHAPHRPAINLGNAMRKVMNAQDAFDRPFGLHALRHACATELLRKGTSLRGIAEFLGHRGLQSVSIYAHCDSRALRRVADISLGGVL